MSQEFYSSIPNGQTSVKQDNINSRKNELTLRSNFSGVSFPENPAIGQHCYREDMNGKEFVYTQAGWQEATDLSTVGKDIALARSGFTSLADKLKISIDDDGSLKNPTTSNVSEWKTIASVPKYVSSTQFWLQGNVTSIFTKYRGLKLLFGTVTKYTSIISSTYDSVNDKTFVNTKDAILTNALSGVEYGIIQYSFEAGATKLATPRKINGVAFDGTTDITITDDTKQPYYSGTIKIAGDANKFYPVAFWCSNGNDGNPFQVNVRRYKHNDSQDKGYLDFEMSGCGSGWGACAPNIYTRYYSNVDFVADAKAGDKNSMMYVWLKGGGTTYYWGSTHPIFSSDIATTDSVTIQNDTLTSKTVCTLPKGVAINGVSVATLGQVVRTDADSVMNNSSTPRVIHGSTGKDWGFSWNPIALVAYDWTNSRTIWNYNPSTSHLALMPTSGIVTSPTPDSTDNSTKVATTAFVQTVSKANGGIVAQSLGETGWVKYANGLIEQWGYATVGAGSTATITLPILLTSTIYNIQVSPNNTTVDSRGDKQDWVGASPASLNAIVIRNGFEHNISSSKIWWKVMGV